MAKNQTIQVKGTEITIVSVQQNDFISLTDMTGGFTEGSGLIGKWITNKNTIEYLGIWEKINNPDFNYTEFGVIEKESGVNRFIMSVGQWIERTRAKGLMVKAGRYGGTFAHKDIAFHFAMWLSPEFQIYLVNEFQRLKEAENNHLQLEWNVKRILSKTNYLLQTDAVQKHIIPKKNYSKDKEWLLYAEEADLLNVALFGCTAKDWRDANAELAKKNMNIRDMASINELTVLSNIESMNAVLIKQGISKQERFEQLHSIANYQLEVLNAKAKEKSLNRSEKLTLPQKKSSKNE
ncbi:MAG TPA: KilA-N domain-containing protein [Bacteroidales bacterium]|nr:KilA-N domain-containing protein [Bacteroidales bacterium]